MPISRVTFLDTPFDLVDQARVLECLDTTNRQAPLRYVVTPNADHVVRCAQSPAMAEIYHQAWLSLCDSRVVVRVARAKGYPMDEVVTGSDLTTALFERVLTPKHRLTIIGGSDELVHRLRSRYRLGTLYHHNPPIGFIHDEAAVATCCRFVADHPADFVLLAVGSPQQERLAARLATTPGCQGVALCIGASLLFLTGFERRAPSWMSRAGLEWLYRLGQNPRRLWRRYWNNLALFPLAWRAPRFKATGLAHRDLEIE